MNSREECPMRHTNGNCLVIGGLCTSVNDEYCSGLREAYECGALREPVRHGRWIEQDGYDGDTYYDCSACGHSWVTIEGTPQDNEMNYCPYCGAHMDEVFDDG